MSHTNAEGIRVGELLRTFARKLLKARSSTVIASALELLAGKLGFALVCIVIIPRSRLSSGHLRAFGHMIKARREMFNALHPLRAHPLFIDACAEDGTVNGSDIRKRRGLSSAAWQNLLPSALRDLETLGFVVRVDDSGRRRDGWFVLLSARHRRIEGLASSLMLVAAHLAFDQVRAVTYERCGRLPMARLSRESIRRVAARRPVDVIRDGRSVRRGSTDRLH